MVEGGETAIRKKRRREEGEVEENGGREGKGRESRRREEEKKQNGVFVVGRRCGGRQRLFVQFLSSIGLSAVSSTSFLSTSPLSPRHVPLLPSQ
jgi:hypothetical protein